MENTLKIAFFKQIVYKKLQKRKKYIIFKICNKLQILCNDFPEYKSIRAIELNTMIFFEKKYKNI